MYSGSIIKTRKIRLEICLLFPMLYQIRNQEGRSTPSHLSVMLAYYFVDSQCNNDRNNTQKIRLQIDSLFPVLYQVQSYWFPSYES